jgi:hypothetical protein
LSLALALSQPCKDIVPHKSKDYNSQNAQNSGKIFVQFFSKFCLTNFCGCGIMEIRAACSRAGASGPPFSFASRLRLTVSD